MTALQELPSEPTAIVTNDKHQFRVDAPDGDWLTCNRTTSGVFFDRSGLVYLNRHDRRALIKWLAETKDEPKPTRPGNGTAKRAGSHRNENTSKARCSDE